jgi:hypothetical protein
MSLSTLLVAQSRIRPARMTVLALVTAGVALTGPPASAEAVAATSVITGTVSFHEASPERLVEVYREVDGAWAEDASLEATVANDGTYTVQAPAGEPVKLRTSYGDHDYGYWYGDGFEADTAVPVQPGAGGTLTGVDLDVPAPAYVTGRVTDRTGTALSALVVPAINNDGGLRPLTAAPIVTPDSGEYTVILPAGYETGVMGVALDGTASDWLGGGSMAEPNFYINTTPGEHRQVPDLVLPLDPGVTPAPAASLPPAPKPLASPAPAATTRLVATGSPVVRGAARKGAVLRATRGRWNLAPTTVRFQWLRDGVAVRHATSPVYRLRGADVRKRISVRVTAVRKGVGQGTVQSSRTAVVRAR